jgi:hypothetical protein
MRWPFFIVIDSSALFDAVGADAFFSTLFANQAVARGRKLKRSSSKIPIFG